jgi:hypothetical protein
LEHILVWIRAKGAGSQPRVSSTGQGQVSTTRQSWCRARVGDGRWAPPKPPAPTLHRDLDLIQDPKGATRIRAHDANFQKGQTATHPTWDLPYRTACDRAPTSLQPPLAGSTCRSARLGSLTESRLRFDFPFPHLSPWPAGVPVFTRVMSLPCRPAAAAGTGAMRDWMIRVDRCPAHCPYRYLDAAGNDTANSTHQPPDRHSPQLLVPFPLEKSPQRLAHRGGAGGF